jgi:hypothetical protein
VLLKLESLLPFSSHIRGCLCSFLFLSIQETANLFFGKISEISFFFTCWFLEPSIRYYETSLNVFAWLRIMLDKLNLSNFKTPVWSNSSVSENRKYDDYNYSGCNCWYYQLDTYNLKLPQLKFRGKGAYSIIKQVYYLCSIVTLYKAFDRGFLYSS